MRCLFCKHVKVKPRDILVISTAVRPIEARNGRGWAVVESNDYDPPSQNNNWTSMEPPLPLEPQLCCYVFLCSAFGLSILHKSGFHSAISSVNIVFRNSYFHIPSYFPLGICCINRMEIKEFNMDHFTHFNAVMSKSSMKLHNFEKCQLTGLTESYLMLGGMLKKKIKSVKCIPTENNKHKDI